MHAAGPWVPQAVCTVIVVLVLYTDLPACPGSAQVLSRAHHRFVQMTHLLLLLHSVQREQTLHSRPVACISWFKCSAKGLSVDLKQLILPGQSLPLAMFAFDLNSDKLCTL